MKTSLAALAASLAIAFPALAEETTESELGPPILVVGQTERPIEIEPRGLAPQAMRRANAGSYLPASRDASTISIR